MLTFKLIEIVDGFYRYEIYPEGNQKDVQVLIFNPQSKTKKLSTFTSDNSNYFIHFVSGLRDEEGNYKTEGMVAWG